MARKPSVIITPAEKALLIKAVKVQIKDASASLKQMQKDQKALLKERALADKLSTKETALAEKALVNFQAQLVALTT